MGVFGEPPTLDPYSGHATDLTFALARPIFPSLYRFEPDGSAVPELARSFEENGGGARIELHEASWSNGEPITARDVVASIRRARSPSGFAHIERARAVGPGVIEIEGLPADVRSALATAAFVLPKGRARLGLSGGPFELERLTPGLQAVYVPNERYFGEGPYLRRLTVQFFASTSIMLTMLEDERLDAAALPSTVNLGDRLAELGLEYDSALGWETVRVDFSSSRLSRPERVAVVGALDQDTLAEGLVRADGRSAYTLFPSPDSAAGPFGADLGRSRAPDGTVLVIAPSGDELLQLVQRVALSQIDDAGIDTDTVLLEAASLYGDDPRNPRGVAVLRTAGAPGLGRPGAGVRSLDGFPLFQVETFAVWRRGLSGVQANPTVEGLLWNAETWWWADGGRR